MSEYKRKNMLLSIIVVFVVVVSVVMYYQAEHGENKNAITAMEAKAIADNVSLNWSKDATLVYVHGTRESQDNGKYMAWGFTYAMSANSNISLGIHVFSNGSTYEEIRTRYSFQYAIYNWTIDSDKAHSIAMKNESIKAFLDKYPDAEVDSFSLSSSGNSSHPVWKIEWVDWGFLDDPHWAHIKIDATTGEVLYAEVNIGSAMTASTIYTLCILSIMLPIIVIIIVSVVYIIRKRKAKERSYAERKNGKEIRERDSEKNEKE